MTSLQTVKGKIGLKVERSFAPTFRRTMRNTFAHAQSTSIWIAMLSMRCAKASKKPCFQLKALWLEREEEAALSLVVIVRLWRKLQLILVCNESELRLKNAVILKVF
jgi:hypothetical protein